MKNNIREARYAFAKRNGEFTQEDAARHFGVSVSTYQKWEQGQGRLNGEILGEIADLYGVSVEYLLDRTKSMTLRDRLIVLDDARELLELYGAMTDDGRAHLMACARGLAATMPRSK